MSGYLFKVSALLAVLQKQILRIGIRFGSKGFSSKLIGDLKISFDIKRKKPLQSKTKGCTFVEKKLLAAKHVYFFYRFFLLLIPLKTNLQVIWF